MEQNKSDIFAGIRDYAIDNGEFQMTITLTVASTDPGIDKYKTVLDEIRNLLEEKFQDL